MQNKRRLQLNQTAQSFANASHIYEEVAERLMAHLVPIILKPTRILEVGAGCGTLYPRLKQQFPHAEIVQLDVAEQRLSRLEAPGIFKKLPAQVCADACQTPFADQQFDLIIANAFLHWVEAKAWFQEAKRLLAENGLLIFSYFGPNTFREIGVQKTPFLDMHDAGDELVRSGFNHPILDSEHLMVEYDHIEDVIQDLTANGELALLELKEVEAVQDLEVTYELVYGHAWQQAKAMTSKIDQDGMVRIGLDQLKRK